MLGDIWAKSEIENLLVNVDSIVRVVKHVHDYFFGVVGKILSHACQVFDFDGSSQFLFFEVVDGFICEHEVALLLPVVLVPLLHFTTHQNNFIFYVDKHSVRDKANKTGTYNREVVW